MKKLFILLTTLYSTNFCLTTLEDPPTFIENSQKIMEQEGVSFRALSAYGYIYNLATTTPQVINSRQAIPFSSHSNLVGVTHTAGSPQITLAAAGTYFVSFVVYAIQVNQFALFLQPNATTAATPICNTNYGVGAAYSPNSGFAIVQTTVPNSILTLVNYTAFITSVNVQGTGQTVVGSTTLAYFDNSNGGGILCGGPINPSVSNSPNSFNGGLQINTINAAVLVQKLD